MKRMLLAFFVLTVGMLFVSSCNEPSPLGAELLEGDQANIKNTDSITFNTITVKEDSILVYDPDPAIDFNNFLIGDYNDPIFGNVKADLNAQLWPSFNAPDFQGAILDSLVLILKYDSTNTYGNLTSDPYHLGVYRLSENMNLEQKYYSSQVFPYDMDNTLGETGDFIPKYGAADTMRVVDYTFSKADTITLPAHLRIHLPEELGEELMDTMLYASTAIFLEQFNGIVVKALSPTKGILSFDLVSSVSNMTLYYHTDTIYQQYTYTFFEDGVKFSNFKHDTAGSIVDDFINNEPEGDSLVFIQSMSGPNIKVEFPNADKLGDIIINKAELIFTYAELEDDDIEVYPPLKRAIISIEDEDTGGFAFISDVLLGASTSNNWFGGEVEKTIDDDGIDINTYSFNISSHFQRIVEGTVSNTIFIRAFPKQERAGRAILYGPKHSKYPVKFKLTYTELNP